MCYKTGQFYLLLTRWSGLVLTDGNHYIDNLLAAAWKTLRLN